MALPTREVGEIGRYEAYWSAALPRFKAGHTMWERRHTEYLQTSRLCCTPQGERQLTIQDCEVLGT